MNVQGFIDILPVIGTGMLGIFAVTLIMILVMVLLNKFTSKE